MRHYNIPIFIPHLGCPYDCIYCDQKKISAQIKVPGTRDILDTIDQHLLTIPSGAEVEVAFFGGNFTAIQPEQQEEYLSLIQPYLKSARIQGIRISTRPDCIESGGLDLLQSYGVKIIELGVQSLNDEVLQASARKYRAEDVYKSSSLIRERGFKLGIQLMVGLPGDNYDRDIETVKKTIKIAPQMVRIYPTLVIAGTELSRMWEAGEYQALALEESVDICKDMYLLFSAAEIPVIRMGLYPGEELRSPGVVKAGPFHPAYGELVEQAVFEDQARMAIQLYFQRFGSAESLYIHVNERDLSKMVGKQRVNIGLLQRNFSLKDLRVKTHYKDPRNWIGLSNNQSDTDIFVFTREEYINERLGKKD